MNSQTDTSRPSAAAFQAMSDMARNPQRLVVGIPTVSRPGILTETIRGIAEQTCLPDLVLICVPDQQDAGEVEQLDLPFDLRILISAKGLCRQRNRILNALQPNDILLFLDDDFLMAPDYLEQVRSVFEANPEVVLATGTLIADGIRGPGLDHAAGSKLLAEGLAQPAPLTLTPAHTGYGCNTAVRIRPILENEVFFDERLPLYSWLEDVDFSNRLKEHGRMVRSAAMRGVHLGTKTGRTPGLRLGYSQIANPIYMRRKGTIGGKRARRLMMRNLASNLHGTVFPVSWADYRGRLLGNLKAIGDLLLGRIDPERILSMKS